MNYCEGCCAYAFNDGDNMVYCYESKYNSEGECPCVKCIVKPMCLTICEDYIEFRRKNTGDRD